jgi:drug/metabolite transporter (DMT)-like permease
MIPAFFAATPAAWVWIPIVVWAAFAQTVRNAAQRNLTTQVGTLPATLVRFLYGLPCAVLWLALVWAGTGSGDAANSSLVSATANATTTAAVHPAIFPTLYPTLFPRFGAWLSLGAMAQLGATALLLMAMKERNFIVAVTWSKTEVLQVALLSVVFLHELPGWVSAVSMLVATVGVVMLARPKPSDTPSTPSGWWSRAALYGVGSGTLFALSAVGYRGAALAQIGVSPWLAGAWTVVWAQLLQSVVLGGYLAWRAPAGLRAIAQAWRLSLLAGTMGALASIGWFTAMAMRPAADVRTLGLLEVLFSYLVSRRIFQEQVSGVEKIGLLLVTLGLIGVCFQF